MPCSGLGAPPRGFPARSEEEAVEGPHPPTAVLGGDEGDLSVEISSALIDTVGGAGSSCRSEGEEPREKGTCPGNPTSEAPGPEGPGQCCGDFLFASPLK